MLSFFLKKKQSPDTPPEEIIQGPQSESTENANAGDDFIFVEKKGENDPSRQPPANNMYPPIPPRFGVAPQYPPIPYPPHGAQSSNVNTHQTAVPYVHDVPFVLAPQLCVKNTFDLTQTQVDGILAFLTRQISLDESEEYSFALERSIQNECY